MDLLIDIFSDFNPRKSGDQVRMECPFTEKHLDGSGQMSMFVSPDINAYHCFSCKSKGKLTSLLVSKFGLGLSEAYTHVDITAYLSGKKIDKKEKIIEDIFYELTTPVMYRNKKRKYPEEVMRKFRVGETKNKVIIPHIEDGRVIGYVQRDKKNPVKYSVDFKRGSYLYNHKTGLRSAIVVEGQADVWRLNEWGLHAVGLGGTEYSERIINLLREEYDELYIATDNDLAGIKCANKLYLDLHKHVDVSFIEYEGPDPDTSTKDSFYEGYKNPKNYFDFKMAFEDILEDQ